MILEKRDWVVIATLTLLTLLTVFGCVMVSNARPSGEEAATVGMLARLYDQLGVRDGGARNACLVVGEIGKALDGPQPVTVPFAKAFLLHIDGNARTAKICAAERDALSDRIGVLESAAAPTGGKETVGAIGTSASQPKGTADGSLGRAQAMIAALKSTGPVACNQAKATAVNFARLLSGSELGGHRVQVMRSGGWFQVAVDAGDDQSVAGSIVAAIHRKVGSNSQAVGHDAYVAIDGRWSVDETCRLTVAIG
jgi:hypothetical protein